MKVLVTGGAGFLGSFIVDALVKEGHDTTIFDSLDEQVHPGGKPPAYLNPDARFVKGDVRDYAALKAVALEAEIIFHEAAAVGVGQSQYEIKKYVDVNIGGTANLLDILANNKHSAQKLMVAASMSSYGEGRYECAKCGGDSIRERESADLEAGEWEPRCARCGAFAEPRPTPEGKGLEGASMYAITKRVQEDMTMNFSRTYGLPAVSLRYFNIYGPRQSLSNPYTGVAAIFLSRLKNDKPPIVYEDGRQLRDFVSVHDVAAANLLAMKKDDANGKIFNVGSGSPISISEISSRLSALLGKPIQAEITRLFRKGDIRTCFADISFIQKEIGFQPAVDFDAGMKELSDWAERETAEDKFSQMESELKSRGIV